MIKNISGFRDLDNLLLRLNEQWEDIKAYTAIQVAQELKELLGDDDKYLQVVEVKRAGTTHYGVTLEPKYKKRSLDSVKDNEVLILAPRSEDRFVEEVAMHGPWLPQNIPFVPKSKDDGFLWLRKTNATEIEVINTENIRKLKQLGIENPEEESPVDQSKIVMIVEDLAFNQLRGEFGLDDDVDPVWRPAIREMIEDRIYEIWDSVIDDFLEEKISIERLGEIEERDGDFFDEFAAFTISVIPNDIPKQFAR